VVAASEVRRANAPSCRSTSMRSFADEVSIDVGASGVTANRREGLESDGFRLKLWTIASGSRSINLLWNAIVVNVELREEMNVDGDAGAYRRPVVT